LEVSELLTDRLFSNNILSKLGADFLFHRLDQSFVLSDGLVPEMLLVLVGVEGVDFSERIKDVFKAELSLLLWGKKS
jgi:ferredoxin-fold anticodon binding domain-containing protein